jgi:cytochrome c5
VITVRTLIALAVVLGLCACGGQDADSSPQNGTADTVSQDAVTSDVRSGKEIYQNYCFSCHTPGLSGAPKLGDIEAWGPRIAKGRDLLVQATIEGVQPAMPPKGMCFDCSDEDIGAVVDYMIEQSQ